MNEKETRTETVQNESNSQLAEKATDQNVQEPTPEEKLAERERLLNEREKALELKERTTAIANLLSEKGLPSELAEIIKIDSSDEKNAETVDRLKVLLEKTRHTGAIAVISTGMTHGNPCSNNESTTFLQGFNRR